MSTSEERHARLFGPAPDEVHRRRVLAALRRIDQTGHVNGKTDDEWARVPGGGAS